MKTEISFCVIVPHGQQECVRKKRNTNEGLCDQGPGSGEWVVHGYFATPGGIEFSKLEVLTGFLHKGWLQAQARAMGCCQVLCPVKSCE